MKIFNNIINGIRAIEEKISHSSHIDDNPTSATASLPINSSQIQENLQNNILKSKESFDIKRLQTAVSQQLPLIKNLVKESQPPLISRSIASSKMALSPSLQLMQAALSVKNQNLAIPQISLGLNRLSNSEFLSLSQDLRDNLNQVSTLLQKLSQLETQGAPLPEINNVKAQLNSAEAKLKSQYGYDRNSLPKAGAIWVDPQFMTPQLNNGKISASQFPVKSPVFTPPSPDKFLFGEGRSLTLTDGKGNDTKVTNSTDYRAIVAANRVKAGIPVNNGEPMAVHLAFEGGGGKGKRYNPALASMFELGVVPTSVTGSSAGSIAAALVAAGADPKDIDNFTKSDSLKKLFDVGLDIDGGIFDGNKAYELFDQKLREITGIKDRPVTFADLPIPLHLIAVKYSDSQLPAGKEDLTKPENRIFLFSQETTPNTPVALAMRASMAIPGVFDPVEMIDPATGREVRLVDGGMLDSLPLGYNNDKLPTIALNLMEQNKNHPDDNRNNRTVKPLPGGQLDPKNSIANGALGLTFTINGAVAAKNYEERNHPPANTFALNIPVWNLNNPNQENTNLKFGYDQGLDPILDSQSREVTNKFFRQFFNKIGDPTASGSNLKPLPSTVSFTRQFELNGKTYTASYNGGNRVHFTDDQGHKVRDIRIGEKDIERWYLDDLAFGDLNSRLRLELDKKI